MWFVIWMENQLQPQGCLLAETRKHVHTNNTLLIVAIRVKFLLSHFFFLRKPPFLFEKYTLAKFYSFYSGDINVCIFDTSERNALFCISFFLSRPFYKHVCRYKSRSSHPLKSSSTLPINSRSELTVGMATDVVRAGEKKAAYPPEINFFPLVRSTSPFLSTPNNEYMTLINVFLFQQR